MFNYSLLTIAYLIGIVTGFVIGIRVVIKIKVKEEPAARADKRAKPVDYDVIPMEGSKDE